MRYNSLCCEPEQLASKFFLSSTVFLFSLKYKTYAFDLVYTSTWSRLKTNCITVGIDWNEEEKDKRRMLNGSVNKIEYDERMGETERERERGGER